ncbi:MAG: YcxB family protein [Aquamicrobium sp.]|uniref:YcxB family protein n=1 Tax=Aquamicrobium sp. TaxID=1872579 RepID=UPI00349E9B60|nr:YcxB family protein [Aquamicrobium sp.]
MTGEAGPGLRGQERFEFAYELEPGDFTALIASQQAAMRAGRKPPSPSRFFAGMLLWLMLVAGLVALQRLGILDSREMAVFVVGVLVGGGAIVAYQRWFYLRTYPRRLIELNRLVGRPQDLLVDPTGLRTRIPGSAAHYEWTAVERIDDICGCVLFWVSGLTAVIVPDRVFKEPAQRNAFLAATREWADVKT